MYGAVVQRNTFWLFKEMEILFSSEERQIYEGLLFFRFNTSWAKIGILKFYGCLEPNFTDVS